MSPKTGQQLEGDARLIETLARGSSQAQAATETGYSTRTIRRRMEHEDFRNAVAAARSAVLTEATGKLAAAAGAAVETLVSLATGAKSEIVRASCARSILELSAKFRETQELADRLAALETASK